MAGDLVAISRDVTAPVAASRSLTAPSVPSVGKARPSGRNLPDVSSTMGPPIALPWVAFPELRMLLMHREQDPPIRPYSIRSVASVLGMNSPRGSRVFVSQIRTPGLPV